jgi:hypothetical protein
MNTVIVCKRLPDGTAEVSGCKHVVRHSPTGMEWGYGGSGPSDLALSALTQWFGPEIADLFYMDYKFKFVATLHRQGGELWFSDAFDWFIEELWKRDKERIHWAQLQKGLSYIRQHHRKHFGEAAQKAIEQIAP